MIISNRFKNSYIFVAITQIRVTNLSTVLLINMLCYVNVLLCYGPIFGIIRKASKTATVHRRKYHVTGCLYFRDYNCQGQNAHTKATGSTSSTVPHLRIMTAKKVKTFKI